MLSLRQVLLFLMGYAAYWMLLSEVDRLLFLVYLGELSEGSFWTNFWATWKAGLKIDTSVTGYLLAVPFLFYIAQLFFIRKPVSIWWLRGYTLVFTVVCAAVTVSNILLYPSWSEKISRRSVMMGVETPQGVLASIDQSMVWQAVIILIVFFTFAHYFYHLVVVRLARYVALRWPYVILLFLGGAFTIFTMIRGGYGPATITPSVAYYSSNTALNHTAVNTYWALLDDFFRSPDQSPYEFMPADEAQAIVATALEHPSDSIPKILNTDRPNIVLIVLEGMVAQVFEKLGGEKGITPGMNALMGEGLTFTQAYSAAERSDKGMIALLSGFPAQGPESIIKHVVKHEKLPAITQVYDSLGYHISFYHGGQSEFYNFKSFLYAHGADKVVDDGDFGRSAARISWGVYDHIVAERMLADLNSTATPFFSMLYTLVNHEPFDMQGEMRFGNATKADAYRSTAYYTDSVVYDLVNQAKQQPWYENTLFVVVSDHGHFYPAEKYDLTRPERFHIPLFMFGGALKDQYRGEIISEIVSQVDLVNTLASFVGDDASRFPYARNLLVPKDRPSAFINSNRMIGVVTPQQSITYDTQGKQFAYVKDEQDPGLDSLLNVVKAYYQNVFTDFQKY